MRPNRPPARPDTQPEPPQAPLTASGIHDANIELLAMSEPGPEHSRVADCRPRSSFPEHEAPSGHEEATITMSARREASTSTDPFPASFDISTQTMTMAQERSPIEMRVHFDEFATQLRAHRDGEYKRRMLEHRRNGLRKGIALSSRLQRMTSWIHDGLVEIGSHHDAASFVHVHQNLQDLTDRCFAHWNQDIQALDPVNLGRPEARSEAEPVIHKLTPEARKDCLDFINSARSKPRFLIDRFKSVSPSQLATLSTSPKFQDLSASVLTSLSQNRGRSSQRKRIQSYSKVLDDYASAFERKNPMSFLLYNCFDSNLATEDALRLDTWSSICAGLYLEAPAAFDSIIKQVLSSFSTMRGWRAKDRLELFLMDVLQRGAFLLEPVGEFRSKAVLQTYVSDTLDTEEAHIFFDNAARQLFAILSNEDGGYPLGAIEFCRAVLSKLPEDAQAGFRTFLAFDWYLDELLRITITYPENEKMLLQFHISESARVNILYQLWYRAQARVRDVFLPDKNQPVDPAISAYFHGIINQIYASGLPAQAYDKEREHSEDPEFIRTPSLTICAPDLIHVLEALTQQVVPASTGFEPFMTSSQSAFNSQYSRSNRFDRLKRELLLYVEPGYTVTNLHPCHERWMTLEICRNGQVTSAGPGAKSKVTTRTPVLSRLGDLDLVQEAAVKLALEDVVPTLGSPRHSQTLAKSLGDAIFQRMRDSQSAADNVGSYYWQKALTALENGFAPDLWATNESRILKKILGKLTCVESDTDSLPLEHEVTALEGQFSLAKAQVMADAVHLSRLKIKIWYIMDVVNSDTYDKAKNISRALNYMAVSGHLSLEPPMSPSVDRERPGTSNSTTSSMFEQPRIDTMNILKAPKEHGGPRKLADDQIDMTKRWLDRNNVENFCKGEERIHRFCMEVKMLTKKLVGETMSDSPALWSSDLWVKEKALFDIAPPSVFNPIASTRPPSVMSETFSSAQFSARPSIRTMDSGSRSLDADLASSPGRKTSFLGFGSSRLNRELLGGDISVNMSPGRSMTTASGESVSTLFSPLPSLGRSTATSASSVSRAPSLYNDFANLKLTDPTSEKAFFLDRLQHELTCLLLSDLGNPVWSQGSETDSWLDVAKNNFNIGQRLSRRKLISHMLPLPKSRPKAPKSARSTPKSQRWSSDDSRLTLKPSKASEDEHNRSGVTTDPREGDLQDVLDRISHQVDPALKLQAVRDFKQLALAFNAETKTNPDIRPPLRGTQKPPRRQSLGPGASASDLKKPTRHTGRDSSASDENFIVDQLKSVLLKLRPTTLFRDLQYIAAFISVDGLSDSEARRAFVHVGLAALAGKDEICRCMVDLAEQIVAKDSIKRLQSQTESAEQSLLRAKDYWMLAAREGNAIAQRELAGLYLAHPEVPPIMSLPLTLSQDIFKNEMRWEDRKDDTNSQALCLALHWMQAAADNGDEVAKRRIRERKETADTTSLR